MKRYPVVPSSPLQFHVDEIEMWVTSESNLNRLQVCPTTFGESRASLLSARQAFMATMFNSATTRPCCMPSKAYGGRQDWNTYRVSR